MNYQRSVHEPDEELLSADDAIADADRLEAIFKAREKDAQMASKTSDVLSEQRIQMYIPLSLLLEAIDHLEPEALRDIVQRAQERLERAA